MRINARLIEEDERRLRELQERTGQTASEVIRTAIRRYFDEMFPGKESAHRALLDSGFVGCGEADPDLSSNYKSELSRVLEEKHADR